MRSLVRVICLAVLICLSLAPVSQAVPLLGSAGVSGGIATGERDIGLGWIVGGTISLPQGLGPVGFRGDVTYQSHDSDPSILGIGANAVFPLGKLYALGGAGWYDSDPGDSNFAIDLGLGLKSAGMLYFEGRWIRINGFTTYPLVVGVRF